MVFIMERKLLGKGTPGFRYKGTKLAGKQGLVVELALDPGHEQLDILWGGHFKGRLDVLAVRP